MSPELIKGEKAYDSKTDIWSFGILAMELADGEPPYISEHPTRLLYKIVMNDPPRINKHRTSDFQDFIDKCLDKDPTKRWTAEMLINHPFLAGAEDMREEWCRTFDAWYRTRDEFF